MQGKRTEGNEKRKGSGEGERVGEIKSAKGR